MQENGRDTPPGRKNWKLIPIPETGGWTRQSRFLPRAREGGGQKMAKKPAKYRKIKADLQDQMEKNQTHGEHFSDLLDDYMSFYETKNLLIQDIQNRGVTVEYNNGGGQKGVKKNESIEQLLKVNTQMLRILDSLGIKAVQEVDGDFDDEL